MDPSGQKLVAFLPWVKLSSSVTVGNVTYMPFEVGGTSQETPLEGLATPLTKMLSSYVDFLDRPVRSCVVVLKAERDPSWNLVRGDFDDVQWCTSLLFLAASAQNEYFQQLPHYVNRAMFDLYWQGFTEPAEFITLTARRRDGELLIGGYRHGQVKFTVPIQADSRQPISPDFRLLQALHAAEVAGADVTRRLRAALSFFSLASTDSDVMLPEAEVILMASAFEQLLVLEDYGARVLSQKFGDLFGPFGSLTVDQALSSRSGVVLDQNYASDQRGWFVHRKWIEELYHLRNAFAHGTAPSARTWGWSRLEHLVVAAFAFPLTVKLCLKQEGYYTLAHEDEVRCGALDLLLAAADWREFQGSNLTVWQKQLSQASRKVRVNKAVAAYRAQQLKNEPQGGKP
jgi:uncharacterized protein (DUF1810 family)